LSVLKQNDILKTMGAGNIWQYGEEILRELNKPIDKNSKFENDKNLEE
jgi:UDP-N-acetylmuramate--alanine ligase